MIENKKIHRNWKLTLSQSTVIPVLILTSLVMGSLLLSQTLNSFSKLQDLYLSQSQILQDTFTRNITQNILLGQYSEVYRLCAEFSKSKLVSEVFVSVPGDETVCGGSFHEASRDMHVIESSVHFDDQKAEEAAKIKVLYDWNGLRNEKRKVLVFNFALLITVLFSNFLIFLLLRIWLIRPLSFIDGALSENRPMALVDRLSRQTFNVREIETLRTGLVSLSHRLIEFQKQELEIESKLVATQIAQSVAHDIRSPLSALTVVNGLLKKKNAPEADLVGSAVDRIQKIAADVLRTTRDAAGIVSGHSLKDICAEVSLIANKFNDRLTFDLTTQLRGLDEWQIRINLFYFSRIIDNLIQNALEAGARNIKISVLADGSEAEIKIEDDGHGIPPHLMAKIGLEQFTHGKSNGTGLGLLGAYRRVRDWNGLLSASEGKTGTVISISLPMFDPTRIA